MPKSEIHINRNLNDSESELFKSSNRSNTRLVEYARMRDSAIEKIEVKHTH